MKVFLRYSPRSDRKLALAIYNTIEELGHKNTSDFVKTIDLAHFYDQSKEVWAERYQTSMKELDEADLTIVETSIPSTAMGQFAQISVSKFKPTILLYSKGNKPHFFQGLAETEKRVLLLEYDLNNLKEVLAYGFSWAEEFLNTRFTLLFPPDIMTHLNSLKKKGVSRSEYIRDLIRRDIAKK